MNDGEPIVKTRGGLLVAWAFLLVFGFELRTALGLFLGIDVPAVPYLGTLAIVLTLFAVLADFQRTSAQRGA